MLFSKPVCSSALGALSMPCITSKTCGKWAASKTPCPIPFGPSRSQSLPSPVRHSSRDFFSKDEILWLAFTSEHGSPMLWLLGVLGAGMTAFYMFRQFFMVFFGKCRADHHTQEHLHESPKVMSLPLVVLAIGAVFAGYVGLPTVFGGSQFARSEER